MSSPARQEMVDSENLENEVALNLLCPSYLAGACLCGACLVLPVSCWWLGGTFQVVKVRQERVLLSMGKYQATIREPGCYFVNPCCLTSRAISTAMESVDLANVKVADGRGNPLLLSGVVTYNVVDAKKAALDVNKYSMYLRTQGTTVMKKVASMYPYEARGDEPSLKSEAEHLRKDLIRLLQERVEISGIKVYNFELNDLAYAPEIAQQMLVRQQAEAVVDARKLIAHGAVEIAHETIKELGSRGVEMNAQEKARMASNLVVTICGESSVTPTVSMG